LSLLLLLVVVVVVVLLLLLLLPVLLAPGGSKGHGTDVLQCSAVAVLPCASRLSA
jgi:hypothetical protein